jgi:hypothetical protein
MIIIGCDFHPSWQQVAVLDSETGEVSEHKLINGDGEAERFYRGLPAPSLIGVSADLKWSQFSRFKCEPLRSPAVRMHTPALAAIWKPQRSRLRVLQHELSVHTCSSRAIQSCPYCGIPVASIFVSTDREAGRNSSALRTAAPERMQGPWPERWSGWKVLTAGDPTFSRRFT